MAKNIQRNQMTASDTSNISNELDEILYTYGTELTDVEHIKMKQALTAYIQQEKSALLKRYQELQHEELTKELVRTDIEARIDELKNWRGSR